jgi:hypothetical protein
MSAPESKLRTQGSSNNNSAMYQLGFLPFVIIIDIYNHNNDHNNDNNNNTNNGNSAMYQLGFLPFVIIVMLCYGMVPFLIIVIISGSACSTGGVHSQAWSTSGIGLGSKSGRG